MATSPDGDGDLHAPADTSPQERSLAVRELAWAALLGRWIQFAQASVALPADGEGGRWKRSIAPFIEVQAIVWALGELAELPEVDRAAARDRAEVQIRRATASLDEIWRGEPMPESMLELLNDATIALREAIYAGLTELVWQGDGVFQVPEVDVGVTQGTLAIMPPGSLAMPGEPVAWFTERPAIAVPGCEARPASRARQVYRQLDPRGVFVEDIIAPLESDIPAGLPMLVALSIDGTLVGRLPMTAEEWRHLQRRGLSDRLTIPVREIH
jgi:hypothetical protein